MTEDTLRTLEDLAQVCRQGARLFRESAAQAPSDALRRLMLDLSAQRTRFIGELLHCVHHSGGDLVSFADAPWAHDSRSPFEVSVVPGAARPDARAVLAACERSECHVVGLYRDALAKVVDADVRDVVRAQAIEVQVAHERVRESLYHLAEMVELRIAN